MADPDEIMEVLTRHGDTVTLAFACDLLPLLGMRFAIRASGMEARQGQDPKGLDGEAATARQDAQGDQA